MLRSLLLAGLMNAAFFVNHPAIAQPATESADAAAKRRLEFMQQVVAGYRFESDEIQDEAAGKLAARPLLRYSDPTRDLMDERASALIDGGVWRLGETGRPRALVVLEVYRAADGKGTLAHEFISLSDKKFSLARDEGTKVQWDATGTDLKLAPLKGAPPPAKSAPARLAQMRQLARRFTAKETLGENVIECRLMSQPIDRYSSEKDGILDGAIFAYANGTNPELAVVLECDEAGWKFGVVRLGAAKSAVELGGREVASFPFFGDYGRTDGPYTSTSHPVQLP